MKQLCKYPTDGQVRVHYAHLTYSSNISLLYSIRIDQQVVEIMPHKKVPINGVKKLKVPQLVLDLYVQKAQCLTHCHRKFLPHKCRRCPVLCNLLTLHIRYADLKPVLALHSLKVHPFEFGLSLCLSMFPVIQTESELYPKTRKHTYAIMITSC